MPFAKGKPKTGGRAKGVANKATTELKAVVLEAFDNLGGVKYLVKVGKENPAVFCALLGKVLPLQLNVAKTVRHVLDLDAFPDEDLETLRAIVIDATATSDRPPALPAPTIAGPDTVN